jgi:hypothetical protein
VAPTKPVNRKTAAAIIEEPAQPTTVGVPVLCGRTWNTKWFQDTKLVQKTPESSDSSADTNSSDKSEEEEDGTAGDSGDEEEEEPAPSPPVSKGKAKRKAEVAATITGKPKSRVTSSTVPISSRLEKKKRSKV